MSTDQFRTHIRLRSDVLLLWLFLFSDFYYAPIARHRMTGQHNCLAQGGGSQFPAAMFPDIGAGSFTRGGQQGSLDGRFAMAGRHNPYSDWSDLCGWDALDSVLGAPPSPARGTVSFKRRCFCMRASLPKSSREVACVSCVAYDSSKPQRNRDVCAAVAALPRGGGRI